MWPIKLLVLALTAVSSARGDRFYSSPPSEAPRPIYVAPPSTENPGPLYLAAMVNQLSTERFKIEGPTPVPPPTTDNRPQQPYNKDAPLQGVLEALYQQAAQNHLQRPPQESSNEQAFSYANMVIVDLGQWPAIDMTI